MKSTLETPSHDRHTMVHKADASLSHAEVPRNGGEIHRVFLRFADGRPSQHPGDCLTAEARAAADKVTGKKNSGWVVQAKTRTGEWVSAIYTNRHVGNGFGESGLRVI